MCVVLPVRIHTQLIFRRSCRNENNVWQKGNRSDSDSREVFKIGQRGGDLEQEKRLF